MSMIACVVMTSVAQATTIFDLNVDFCNEANLTKTLSVQTKSNQDTPLCIQFTNPTTGSIDLSLGFPNGVVTNDSSKIRTCMDEVATNYFGDYVTGYDKIITIPANSTVKINPSIRFPQGYVGTSYGCVSYVQHIDNKDPNQSGVNVVTRRVSLIDVFVDGKIQLDGNLISSIGSYFRDNVFYYIDGSSALASNFINKSNVAVTMSGVIERSALGGLLKKYQTIDPNMVIPNQETTISVPLPRYLFSMPGGVKMAARVHYVAQLPPLVDQPQVDTKDLLYEKNIVSSMSIVASIAFPILLLLLVVIAYMVYRRLRKHKYSSHVEKSHKKSL